MFNVFLDLLDLGSPERISGNSTAIAEVQESSIPTEKLHQYRLLILTLIFSNLCTVILSSLFILLLVLRKKRGKSIPPNTNEAKEMSVIADNYDDVGAAEVPLYEEVKYGQAAARPPSVGLCEEPIRLSPRSARKVKAMPERQRSFEKFGEAPLAPVEYDDVGPVEPEHLYDDVAPETSRTPRCKDATSDSAQYLKLLPLSLL
ncbi:Hypothetical predicted protein [Cloeon dipterum]|uniref:Uncharacterized protein n=1 Tax=Cloeon dipterum TaxID=197152 RepID=A0A8S1DWS2_9INSE|nr:Hypothetical predicted protein [Cloeon dipterum]